MEIEAHPVSIFCGYAHEDAALFNQLNKHLAVLRSQQYITLWHYGEIPPGAEWESAITRHLDQADILLLISPGFMDSEYCRGKEMRRAIERHKTGEVHLIPILLRPTPDWKTTALGSLQALPTHAKPVTIWRSRDEAFANIADRIYAEHKNYGVKVSFSSQVPGSSARIRLTRDTTSDGTFYRAHELFSVRTILSILQEEIPYKQVAQMVKEACHFPEKMEEK